MATSTPSDNQVYLFRLQALVIDVGNTVVRNVLDQKLQGVSLSVFLTRERPALDQMRRRNMIARSDWDLLFPQYGPPTTDAIPIGLATQLLLNLKGLGFKSVRGGPRPGDLSPEADIYRLRLHRNEIAHMTPTAVNETIFREKWSEIEQLLNRLNHSTPHPVQDLQEKIDSYQLSFPYDTEEKLKMKDIAYTRPRVHKAFSVPTEFEYETTTRPSFVKLLNRLNHSTPHPVQDLQEKIDSYQLSFPYDTEEKLKMKDLKEDLISFYRNAFDKVSLSPLPGEMADVTFLKVYEPPFPLESVSISKFKSIGKQDSRNPEESQTKEVNSLKSVFVDENCNYKNIYITAEPGLGKTCFAKWLVLNWCQAHDPIHKDIDFFRNENLEHVKDFDFVFLLPLRDMAMENVDVDTMLQERLIAQLSRQTRYTNDFLEALLSRRKCLFILDGLDEWAMSNNSPGSVPPRKSRQTCSYITTSRPSKFSVVSLDSSQIDRHIQIRTANTEKVIGHVVLNILNCVKENDKTGQLLKDWNVEDAHRAFMKFITEKQMEHIYSSPFYIIQKLNLWILKPEVRTSRCDMYTDIIELLLHRTSMQPSLPSSLKSLPSTKVNYFTERAANCAMYSGFLFSLGKIAFALLFNGTIYNSLFFSKKQVREHLSAFSTGTCSVDDILESSLTAGLLVEQKFPCFPAMFSFCHRPIQEYFAALYIQSRPDDPVVFETIKKQCSTNSAVLEMAGLFDLLEELNPKIIGELSQALPSTIDASLLCKSNLPKEVLMMDRDSIDLYKKALQEGKVSVHNIRVMVVGHYDVGKTTLTKRLLGQPVDITKRDSTNGIDVHVQRCNISLKDGAWILSKSNKARKAIFHQLAKLFNSDDQQTETQPKVLEEMNIVSDIGDLSADKARKAIFHQLAKLFNSDDQQTETQPKVLEEMNIVSDIGDISAGSGVDVDKAQEQTVASEHLVEEIEDSEEKRTYSRIQTASMRDNSSRPSTLNIEESVDEEYAQNIGHLKKFIENVQVEKENLGTSDLSVWDFAGQNVFYATHPVFFSRRAIYLLVTNMSKHLNDTVDDDPWRTDCKGEVKCKIAEYIDFWLNSIHEFCSYPGGEGPPVVLVGTFADQLTEEMSPEDACSTLREFLVEKAASCHLTTENFLLDNSVEDEKIKTLRKHIVDAASKQDYWGEDIPAKWVTLEDILIGLKEENLKVLHKDRLRELNKTLLAPIESDEELELYLHFHHDMGNILYFSKDDLTNYILLDAQWLIDAFKSVITAKSFCISRTNTSIRKEWMDFERTAILKPGLIDSVWEKLENSEYKKYRELLLTFMEILGLVARPIQQENQSAKVEDWYFVPCMLKEPPPEKVTSSCDSQHCKSTSKLCYTTAEEPDRRFLPATVFNKLLAACLQKWSLSNQNGKSMIFCGGAIFNLTENHFLYIFFYEQVIQIWITRLSLDGQFPDISLCTEAKDNIEYILRTNIRMCSKIIPFVKCPRAVLYSNENMLQLEDTEEISSTEIVCYCQDKEHVVRYDDLTKYWSYDQDSNHAMGFENDHDSHLTEKDFSTIARRIGKEYLQLGRKLGLTKENLDHIELDNRTTQDRIVAMLCEWKKQMPNKATVYELRRALTAIGKDASEVLRL